MRYLISVLLLSFALQLCVAQQIEFKLVVYDKMNRNPIAEAQVKLQDLNSLREYSLQTSDSGFVNFKLATNTRYRLEVSKNSSGSSTGYLSYTYMLSEKEVASKKVFETELEKVKHTDAGILPTMYFDYNKTALSEDNLASLENACKMFTGFPTLQIEIGMYSDCRETNDILSKRAAAIVNFFATKNQAKKVVVKEYGNQRPLNQCDCSNKNFVCSEEKYFENRRAEFKVLSF